jgi:hypothetical protein
MIYPSKVPKVRKKPPKIPKSCILATPLVVTIKVDEKIKTIHFGDGKLLKYPFEKKKKKKKINFELCPPKQRHFEGKKEKKRKENL